MGLQNATHLYLQSTCFSPALMRSIVNLARATPSLRCILNTGKGDTRAELAAWGGPVSSTPVELSWANSILFYHPRGAPWRHPDRVPWKVQQRARRNMDRATAALMASLAAANLGANVTMDTLLKRVVPRTVTKPSEGAARARGA